MAAGHRRQTALYISPRRIRSKPYQNMEPFNPRTGIAFLMLSIIFLGSSDAADATCNAQDRAALLDLKAGFVGSGETLTSWKGENCCSWLGVTCNPKSGRVVELNLEFGQLNGAKLQGTISPSIGKLKQLEILDLSENGLQGPLPSSVGDLSKLQQLKLSRMSLNGTIPQTLKNLSQLKVLYLFSNRFTGSISPTLSRLSNLQYLDLSDNDFTGCIPSELGLLSKLILLDLSNNQGAIGCKIPATLGSLSSLQDLILDNLSLTGSIPPSLGHLTNLTDLWLRNNSISGPVPNSFSSLSQLYNLLISGNRMTGLPSDLSKLTNLNKLEMSRNPLSFDQIKAIGKIKGLAYLELDSCQLKGSVPEGFFPASLELVSLQMNKITGLPSNMQDLRRLRLIYLQGNNLKFENLGGLKQVSNLERAYLQSCNLKGNLPQGFVSSSPFELDLSNNFITGVPANMADLKNLSIINLDGNQLHFDAIKGLTTAPALWVISLSRCNLREKIPSWITRLLKQNDSAENALPKVLDLSHNQIAGGIPEYFSQLIGLERLYLDNNVLAGPLPAKLASLSQLTTLDVFNNHISGSIPKAFLNHPSLTELNVANNSMTGEIPQGPPFSTMPASYFEGNKLCGSPLPPC